MNTHDIELPPLPSPFGIVDPMGSGEKIYTLKDMGDYARAYARAAIEADRKLLRGVNSTHTLGEPVAYLQAENLVRLAQPHVAGCAASIQKEPADGFIPIFTAPHPTEPVKPHLSVSYDDKVDCLYVVCDSNEPADAEEDDKGILYRRAISDGRLVGITIMNFMGPHAKWSDDVQRPAEPVKVPSDADAKHIQDFIACDGMGAVIVEGPQYSAVVRALLARYSKGAP